ncbi:MAG: hypothetical protein HW377_2229, partial [Actinobacteria bacterium]|nr:hypothetical protein [Actinomycetota bacterium]
MQTPCKQLPFGGGGKIGGEGP